MTGAAYSERALAYFRSHATLPAIAAAVGVAERDGALVFTYARPDGSTFQRRRPLRDARARVIQPRGVPLIPWWPCGRDGEAALICEGEGDTLAVVSALYTAENGSLARREGLPPVVLGLVPVGIPGTGTPAERVTEAIEAAGLGTAYIALDGDEAGRRATARLAAALHGASIRAITVELPDGPDLADCLADLPEAERAEWFANLIADAEAATSPAPRVGDVGPGRATGEWPARLAEAAYQGRAGKIVRAIEPQTEADPAALLAHLLAAFGSACGRGPALQVEGDRHGAALYIAIVGATAKGRKGTAAGRIRQLMQLADPDWHSACVSGGLSSGEGLIWQVRDPIKERRGARSDDERARADGDGCIEEVEDPGVSDKRLLVEQGEFAQVLKVMQREGNTLSPILRDLWDRGAARTSTKRDPARTTGAHVSLIGHVTQDELRQGLAAIETVNGFANRFLFVCAKRARVLPFGGDLDQATVEQLAGELRDSLAFARGVSEVAMDDAARERWVGVYPKLSEGLPGLLGAVTSRAEAQVLRLAITYAMLDRSPVIGRAHLDAALAFWGYCFESARQVFGGKLGDALADRLLADLREAGPDGLTRSEIRERVGNRVLAHSIEEALSLLASHGLAERRPEPSGPEGGRPSERWAVPAGRVEETPDAWSKPPSAGGLLHQSGVSSTVETRRPTWLDSPTLPAAQRDGLEAAQALVDAGEAEWIEGPTDYTGALVLDYTDGGGS